MKVKRKFIAIRKELVRIYEIESFEMHHEVQLNLGDFGMSIVMRRISLGFGSNNVYFERSIIVFLNREQR